MKTGPILGIMALVAGALAAGPPLSFAGGTMTGTVSYTGKAEEKEHLFRLSPNPNFCPKIGTDGHKPDLVKGDKRILKTIEVDKGGALTAAVVAVTDIEDSVWKDGFEGTRMVVKFCEFVPYTGVVVNEGNFHVENTDHDPDDQKSVKGVLHSAHASELKGVWYTSLPLEVFGVGHIIRDFLKMKDSRTIFNFMLSEKGSTGDKKVILRKVDQDSFLLLLCDQHSWEQAYFLPVKNPHYAVTGTGGSFTIKNVPAGKHKVIAWHPFAGRVEADVEVKEGATVMANFRITQQTVSEKKNGR